MVQVSDFAHSSGAYNEQLLPQKVLAEDGGAYRSNNENDPAAINRVPISDAERYALAGDTNKKVGGEPIIGSAGGAAAAPRSRSALALKSVNGGSSNNNIGTIGDGMTTNSAASSSAAATSKSNSATALQMMSSARTSTRSQAAAAAASTATTTNSSAGAGVKQNPYSSSSSAAIARPSSSSSSSTSSRAQSSATTATAYPQKFDIYVDSKPAAERRPSSSSTAAVSSGSSRGKPFAGEAPMSTQPAQLHGPGGGASRRPSATSQQQQHYEFEIDRMQTDFEHVQLETAAAGGVGNAKHAASATSPSGGAHTGVTEAWAWSQQPGPAPAVHISTPTPHTVAAVHNNNYNHHQQQYNQQMQQLDQQHQQGNGAAAESEPMCISTPPDQVLRGSRECGNKPLGTLETMHDMLNNSFSVVDNGGGAAGAAAQRINGSNGAVNAANRWAQDVPESVATKGNNSLVAKVWVVRYVDYTSKYGLGFLFNTGSAGVYFNDSTKIVLSADGTVFQYTERRRRDSSMGSEHSSQKHLITSYPPELQKKVTLLKHFRNYLVDQQKNSSKSANGGGGSSSGGGGGDSDAGSMAGNPGLIRDGMVSEGGACASVKFGQSSTRYSSIEENNYASQRSGGGNLQQQAPVSPLAMQLGDEDEEGDADVDMPFLKKWVRTKHAILFRISNRTVQVVFYDRR